MATNKKAATAIQEPLEAEVQPQPVPVKAEIVPAALANMELAAPPSAEEVLKSAERQIQIFRGYVKLVAKFVRPEDVLVFGKEGKEIYLPAKPCRDILSWARINVKPHWPITEHRYQSPDGDFIEFEISATISDQNGRQVDVIGNRSSRDDFFGIDCVLWVCPECGEETEKGRWNDSKKRYDNTCKKHGQIDAERKAVYLPLYDVDLASVRQAAVTNLWNHALKAVGLCPTLQDLSEAGMDISKVQRVDFREKKEKPVGSQNVGNSGPRTTYPPASSQRAAAPPSPSPQSSSSKRSDETPPAVASTASVPDSNLQRVKGEMEAVHHTTPAGAPLKSARGTEYVKVSVGGMYWFVYNNQKRTVGRAEDTIFRLLKAQRCPCRVEFLAKIEETDKGTFRKVADWLVLGDLEWEEGTGIPVVQRNADMPAPPPFDNQHGITDEDIPF